MNDGSTDVVIQTDLNTAGSISKIQTLYEWMYWFTQTTNFCTKTMRGRGSNHQVCHCLYTGIVHYVTFLC